MKILLFICVVCMLCPINHAFASPLDDSFFTGREVFVEIADKEGSLRQETITFDLAAGPENAFYIMTMEYDDVKEISYLDKALLPVLSFKEIDGKKEIEIEYGDREILFKEGDKIVKKIRRKK